MLKESKKIQKAPEIKEFLHNEKENGFFDDKNKSFKKIDEKNILDYRYEEGASPYSYTACAIEVF